MYDPNYVKYPGEANLETENGLEVARYWERHGGKGSERGTGNNCLIGMEFLYGIIKVC